MLHINWAASSPSDGPMKSSWSSNLNRERRTAAVSFQSSLKHILIQADWKRRRERRKDEDRNSPEMNPRSCRLLSSGSEALTINWCLSSEASWAASESFTDLETVYSDTVQILQKPVHTWWVKIQSGCFSGWRLLFSAGSDSNNSRTFMLNVNVVF